MPRIFGKPNPFSGHDRLSAARMKAKEPRGQRGSHRFRPLLMELENRRLLSLTVLASFNGYNGLYPEAGVIMDSSGDLYGTTSDGGTLGGGTIFELAHGSSTITVLASFSYNGGTGYAPEGEMVLDSSGDLFGTTSTGGTFGYGAIFELAHGSSTITALASFNGTTTGGFSSTGYGAEPEGSVVMDSAGNLYGTTTSGGAFGTGTIFELAQGSNTITTRASLSGNGYYQASVIVDSSGNLYGTTTQFEGTIFELAHGSSTITTLAYFNITNGLQPASGVIMDSSGNLYGTTQAGGANPSKANGTIFKLAHGSSTPTALASFNGTTTGGQPVAGVVMDSSGDLYGTTQAGGSSGYGTIFELAHGSSTITTLASFSGYLTGDEPQLAGVIVDSSGNLLYGTTTFGGADSDGTIFEYIKITSPNIALLSAPNPSSYPTFRTSRLRYL